MSSLPTQTSVVPEALLDNSPKGTPITIAEPQALAACTYNECPKGHRWDALLQLTACPGCGKQMLAVKMVNCPICNEPTKAFHLRTDHLPGNSSAPARGVITPVCKGAASLAEIIFVDVTRGHAAAEQARVNAEGERVMDGKV